MTTIGPLIAVGRTSDVYEYGVDSVVKVPRPDVPAHWAALEASHTSVVRELGAPAPDVRGLVEIDGRESIVFGRVDGESMWQVMLARPGDAQTLADELAAIHRRILSTGLPHGLTGLVDRMCRKIDEVEQLSNDERDEAKSLVRCLPRGAALLHGDLHPGNVLMSSDGPIVIDWFDASIGHPVADVVRSSLLIRPTGGTDAPHHLPGADPELLRRVHDAYVTAMTDVLAVPDDVLRLWEAVRAAGRLAERIPSDEASLIALWNGRRGDIVSPLVASVSGSGAVADQLAE